MKRDGNDGKEAEATQEANVAARRSECGTHTREKHSTMNAACKDERLNRSMIGNLTNESDQHTGRRALTWQG
ncbi:hypothetical protein R1flu_022965 [Riccia fluitans]|uniref:Uncharacterized protein n=1 Tax=Riccia fluitans TaxID=41844 RepID=A0ABD1XQN9_9MARC